MESDYEMDINQNQKITTFQIISLYGCVFLVSFFFLVYPEESKKTHQMLITSVAEVVSAVDDVKLPG